MQVGVFLVVFLLLCFCGDKDARSVSVFLIIYLHYLAQLIPAII